MSTTLIRPANDLLVHRPSSIFSAGHLPLLLVVLFLWAVPSLAQEPEPSALFTSVSAGTASPYALDVTVVWGDVSVDHPLLLSLQNTSGEEVDSTWVWPQPGTEATYVLPEALWEATSRPQHHRLQWIDAGGAAWGEPYPLQLGLECDSPERCRFTVRGGISAPNMMVIRPAMAAALAEAVAAGVDDVLSYIGETQPNLWGDVYGMAWQTAALQGSESEGLGGEKAQTPGDGGSGCTCNWNLQVVNDPISIQETSDLGADQTPECGASRGVTYRRVGSATSITEMTVTGRSSLTPTVSCWTVTELEPLPINVGEGVQALRMVALSPCSTPCTGSVAFSGTYTTALTTSTRTAGDKATVLDGFDFWVGGQQVAWNLFGFSTQGSVDDQASYTGGGVAIGVLGATAEMYAGTSVTLEYDPTGTASTGGLNLPCNNALTGGMACAEGTSDATYGIHMQGQSSCTGSLLYEASATVVPQAATEGVHGDDISILVGKCNDD